MRKTLQIVSSETGWYAIKVSCDEGIVATNVKLEKGKPLELSFINDSKRQENDLEEVNRQIKNVSWNKNKGQKKTKFKRSYR